MRLIHALPLAAAAAAALTAGVALGSHQQVDPNSVPVGFLTAHSRMNDIPAAEIARALKSGKADVFLQHGRLAPNEAAPFHTHPGPSFIVVQGGSLGYEEAAGGRCIRRRYGISRSFVDGPSRHVHRIVAGAGGADYYEVFLLPRKTGPEFSNAPAPAECA
jgi:hypothetical protein